jgi:hypothetical protein
MTPVTAKQVLRSARVPRASLRMTSFCLRLKKKKKEASAHVIPSAAGARDLLLWEPL